MPYIILHQADDELQAEGYCEAYPVVDNDDLSRIMISMGLSFKRGLERSKNQSIRVEYRTERANNIGSNLLTGWCAYSQQQISTLISPDPRLEYLHYSLQKAMCSFSIHKEMQHVARIEDYSRSHELTNTSDREIASYHTTFQSL